MGAIAGMARRRMIAAALLALLLDAPALTAPTCPLAAPPDMSVSCPGWRTRTCRERDASGALIRRNDVKREFLQRHGFKGSSVPGRVIDHLYALACGGCDVAWNLQLQTEADGKRKDRWELFVCRERAQALISMGRLR